MCPTRVKHISSKASMVRLATKSCLFEHGVRGMLASNKRFPPDDKSARSALSGNGVVRGVIILGKHWIPDALRH